MGLDHTVETKGAKAAAAPAHSIPRSKPTCRPKPRSTPSQADEKSNVSSFLSYWKRSARGVTVRLSLEGFAASFPRKREPRLLWAAPGVSLPRKPRCHCLRTQESRPLCMSLPPHAGI